MKLIAYHDSQKVLGPQIIGDHRLEITELLGVAISAADFNLTIALHPSAT